ncbi:hypothetical protein PHMEG_00012139 [Phytophthora megakarya]|uniref:Ndc10 domain-containing protein n=1 Tax=Phytophthora megakarya TaxID=4795 RepID=A0A225W9G8_9STRA|nr:hypothetical protein PHMEG_00012139 [Phytophthora megakarya]
MLASLRREKHQKDKREYADRGVGSLIDGHCIIDDLVTISQFYMNLNTGSDLLNRMCQFIWYACLLRGETARNMELPDMFSVILEHEGFTEYRALLRIMEQGNQYGRHEFKSCIRHRNVEVCPIGALGFYIFYRWSVQNEDMPNFLVPEECTESRKNRTTPLTYRAHYDAIVKTFTALATTQKQRRTLLADRAPGWLS